MKMRVILACSSREFRRKWKSHLNYTYIKGEFSSAEGDIG